MEFTLLYDNQFEYLTKKPKTNIITTNKCLAAVSELHPTLRDLDFEA